MPPPDGNSPISGESNIRQTAQADQGGTVNQLGHGTQINGLSSGAAIGLVAATVSIALAAVLTFVVVSDSGSSRPEPRTDSVRSTSSAYPGSGQLAGSTNDVKAVFSMPREGGVRASAYLPTGEEERDYLTHIGEAREKPGYADFAARQNLASVNNDSYKLTITNVSGATIRIVNIKPVVLQRKSPIKEALYYPCCGAGGEEGVVATLDLDDPQPYLAQGRADYFSGHSVPVGPGDAFDIFISARTSKYHCSYSFDVQYTNSAGDLQHLEVLHPDWLSGKRIPFELTAGIADGETYQRQYVPTLLTPGSTWRDGYYVRSDNQPPRS